MNQFIFASFDMAQFDAFLQRDLLVVVDEQMDLFNWIMDLIIFDTLFIYLNNS
jgi:hypothetical protein